MLASRLPTANGYTDLTGQYEWKPVKIGGGGWDVGMWVHPTEQDLAYCRSDVGGAYRWEPIAGEWTNVVTVGSMPMPAGSYYGNYQGVDSIVGAPSDPDIAYMAFRRNVYKSTNRGDTWVKTSTTLDVEMQPNGAGRQEGERLAVDPANPDVVYYGSVANGLWVTTNGGNSWSQISTGQVPTGGANHGVNTVVFDPTSGTVGGKTSVIYVTVWQQGVYRTSDAGSNWSQINSGGPAANLRPHDAEAGPDGTFFVAYQDDQQIWKYSGTWTEITPGAQSWNDIAVDPFNAQRLFTTNNGAGNFWRSLNQGATWTKINRATFSDISWQHTYYLGSSWMSVGEIVFDPTVQDRMWFAEGFGMWRTSDVGDSQITWYSVSRGIEDTCAKDVLCPVRGKPVMAKMDLNVHYHSDPDQYNAQQMAVTFSGAWTLDDCGGDPLFIATISEMQGHNESGYSTNGGQTWTKFASVPSDKQGVPRGVGVSATDPDNIIWFNGADNKVWYTTNRGSSWSGPISLGTPLTTGWGPGNEAVAADKVDGGTFYIYNWAGDADAGVWRSTDGGATWSHVSTALPKWRFPCVEATSGNAGHVWFCSNASGQGLYRSTNYGSNWTLVPGTDFAQAIGFGKADAGAIYPTIYYAGKLNGVEGIWRSINEAATWARICDYPLGIYSNVVAIDGDPDVFGKVYVALDGKGFAYGEPNTMDIWDLDVFVDQWLDTGDCSADPNCADLDASLKVDFKDFAIMGNSWGFYPAPAMRRLEMPHRNML